MPMAAEPPQPQKIIVMKGGSKKAQRSELYKSRRRISKVLALKRSIKEQISAEKEKESAEHSEEEELKAYTGVIEELP